MNIERKVSYEPEFQVVDLTNGQLKGYANVFGNLDRNGEVVAKGAFVNLDSFLKNGFLAVDHDWSIPVGYLDVAQQDERGLYIEAVLHDTPKGQEVRQVITERLKAGKSVGMSIGYKVLADEWVDGVRHLTQVELFEASVVTVPANPKAIVIEAKAVEPEAPVEVIDNSLPAKRAYLAYLDRRRAA